MAWMMNAFKTTRSIPIAIFLFFALTFFTGCQNGPTLGRMQQSKLENERLLSEFRSQKKENEQLRADRTRLLQQQAETEKLAAKLQAQLSNGKAIAAQNPIGRTDFGLGMPRSSSELSSFDKGRPGDRISPASPAARPDSLNTRSASNAESLQWRPIRKETR